MAVRGRPTRTWGDLALDNVDAMPGVARSTPGMGWPSSGPSGAPGVMHSDPRHPLWLGMLALSLALTSCYIAKYILPHGPASLLVCFVSMSSRPKMSMAV